MVPPDEGPLRRRSGHVKHTRWPTTSAAVCSRCFSSKGVGSAVQCHSPAPGNVRSVRVLLTKLETQGARAAPVFWARKPVSVQPYLASVLPEFGLLEQ